MRTPLRLPASLLLLLAALTASAAASAPPAAADGWSPLWEHWYSLEIAGATAGWMRETASTDGRRFRTHTEMQLRIARAGGVVQVESSSTFLETTHGRPLELHTTQDSGKQTLDTRWTFGADGVESVVVQGARRTERALGKVPEGWLTPMSVRRLWQDRLESKRGTVDYWTLDGENGLEPTHVEHVRVSEGVETFDGREIPVTVWRRTSSAMPGIESTIKVSSDGQLLEEEVTVPLGRMMTRITTKDAALAAAKRPPPELMLQSFVAVNEPISRPRGTVESTLRLRVREGEMPELPSAGAQRFALEDGGRAALVRVNIHDNLPATDEEIDDAAFREPSALADSDDALVAKLAARASRRAGDDPATKAEALRRFVHRHIRAKDLDTAFATASETARMRTGDCSEHGVLLCAMLRAAGIPSRVATGLVYADQFAGARAIFGWHMWTQALIDGRWVDYDATLAKRYDAVHVLTGTSSLADGSGAQDLSSMLLLLGNLEIDAVELIHGDVERAPARR